VVAEAGGAGVPIRGVALQGRAEFLSDGPERRALVDRFHKKYSDLKSYWGGHEMPSDRVMFRIVAARVREWGP
jgi:nitroimidazol reductase NimA-like FMN-containing flavoprotein (pyridoxamine 5'-phosphate oxidase superfamily)